MSDWCCLHEASINRLLPSRSVTWQKMLPIHSTFTVLYHYDWAIILYWELWASSHHAVQTWSLNVCGHTGTCVNLNVIPETSNMSWSVQKPQIKGGFMNLSICFLLIKICVHLFMLVKFYYLLVFWGEKSGDWEYWCVATPRSKKGSFIVLPGQNPTWPSS